MILHFVEFTSEHWIMSHAVELISEHWDIVALCRINVNTFESCSNMWDNYGTEEILLRNKPALKAARCAQTLPNTTPP